MCVCVWEDRLDLLYGHPYHSNDISENMHGECNDSILAMINRF